MKRFCLIWALLFLALAGCHSPELMEAMAHYDSLGCPFLSARCHYMNGVGYYEMDSVVQACVQYLKALEIMEEHYEEKALVGYKAKFMALAYGHLCALFTDQYLHVQAVGFAKQAFEYYQKQGVSSWQSAWAFKSINASFNPQKYRDEIRGRTYLSSHSFSVQR